MMPPAVSANTNLRNTRVRAISSSFMASTGEVAVAVGGRLIELEARRGAPICWVGRTWIGSAGTPVASASVEASSSAVASDSAGSAPGSLS